MNHTIKVKGFSLINEQEKFILKTKDEETEDLGGDFGAERRIV